MIVLRKDTVDDILRAADAECAMLYLYLTYNNGRIDPVQAAADLKRTEADIQSAAKRLADMGIVSTVSVTSSSRKAEPTKDEPARDMERHATAPSGNKAREENFRALLAEIQSMRGQVLNTTELQSLCSVYDTLKLPPEALVLLAQYCQENAKRTKGPSGKFSFKTLEKIARTWETDGVDSYEKAEQWIEETTARRRKLSEVLKAIGYSDNDPSPAMKDYIFSWLKLGFGPEEIALAADRTIVRFGDLKFQYANAILTEWDKKGLHTLREIETGDLPPQKQQPQPVPQENGNLTKRALEDMRKLREALRNE